MPLNRNYTFTTISGTVRGAAPRGENSFHKPVFHREAIIALDMLEKTTPEGKKYFGRDNGMPWATFEREVKEFPKKQGRFPTLVWDGVHTLRHGGVNWLKSNENLTEKQRRQAAAMTDGTFRHYGRSNAQRLLEMRLGRKRSRQEIEEYKEFPPE